MLTPELKCPTTNLTPAVTKLLATETPCLGSPTSSPTAEETFLPRMPPPSLTSAIACSAPCFNCAPKAASDPVKGPPMPNLIVSLPLPPHPARTRPAPKTRPSVKSLFIDGLLSETDVIEAASVAEVTPDWKRPRHLARAVA